MDSVRLLNRIVQSLAALGLPVSRPELTNLALLCQALAFSPSCHLATLALALPTAGQRENRVQRLRRCLKNAHLAAPCCYAPLLRYLLGQCAGRELCLVMDRTDIQDRLSILMLGVCYRKHVLPLTWQVLRFGGTGAAEQLPLLQRVAPHLPAGVRVCFYADSEFRPLELQSWCRQQRWHWQIGVHRTLSFSFDQHAWQPLQNLGLQPGERRYLQGIWLRQTRAFGPVNVIADWPANEKAPAYWALDLPANAQAWRRGRKRFWIEPSFRHWKRYGFDLEASQLTEPARLEVLLLGIALAMLWLVHIGEWLVSSGRRQEFGSAHPDDYSLFRLGRDYLQRSRTVHLAIPVGFALAGVA